MDFWQRRVVENLGMYSWFSDFALVIRSYTAVSGLKERCEEESVWTVGDGA